MIVMFHSDISLGVYDLIFFVYMQIRSVIFEIRKDDITERQMNAD